MLRIDCAGLNSFHKKIETTRSPDDRGEHEFSKVIAKSIMLQNHLIENRLQDLSPQERANFLLQGRRDEVSLTLKFETLPDETPAGFFIRLPANNYPPDLLIRDLLCKWFSLIPDFNDYTLDKNINKRKPLLLPPRSTDITRPARCEIVLCVWQAPDWEFWVTPTRLKILGQHISRAINQFDDEFNNIDWGVEENKSIMDVVAEELKPTQGG